MRTFLAVVTCAFALLMAGPAFAAAGHQDNFVPAFGAGGIISDNGQMDLAVGVDTYSNPMNIRYTPDLFYSVPPPPAGTIWVSSPFSIQIFDTELERMISTDKPMMLSIHYAPADLGGRSESTLRIIRLYDTWVEMPSTIDTTRHVVSLPITFGGEYGLIANNVEPAAPPAAPAPPPPPAAPAPAPAAPAPTAPAAPVAAAPTATGSIIAGKVFFDRNGNGVMDGEDFPVSGAGVILTSGDWYAFTRAKADGAYGFGGLSGGSYTANVVVGPEWAYTTPVSVTSLTVTGLADSATIASFGLWYK